MTATYTEAVDEIFTLFKMAWDAHADEVTGQDGSKLVWHKVEEDEQPDTDHFWGYAFQTILPSNQVALGPNCKKWRTAGVATLEIRIPKHANMHTGRLLAERIDSDLRKQKENLFSFRHAIVELPAIAKEYRINVEFDFYFETHHELVTNQ